MNQLGFPLFSVYAEENSNRGSFLQAPTERTKQERLDYAWYPVSVMVVFVGILIWGFFILGRWKKNEKIRRVKTKKKYGRWMNKPY